MNIPAYEVAKARDGAGRLPLEIALVQHMHGAPGALVLQVLEAYRGAALERLSDAVPVPYPAGRTVAVSDVVMLKPGIAQREADDDWILHAGVPVTIMSVLEVESVGKMSVRDAQGEVHKYFHTEDMALAAGKGCMALHVALAWKDIEVEVVRGLLNVHPEVRLMRRRGEVIREKGKWE